MTGNEKVERYLNKHANWNTSLSKLRAIMLECGLEEDYKWSLPVYTYSGSNIAGIGATKNYTGVWFFQGGLLSDPEGVLVNAQEGKTKAMRQWRFTSEKEINKKKLIAYLKEAIQNQQAGLMIKADRRKQLNIPPYLEQALLHDVSLKSAFEQLTLSKKRDFAEYIETAKQMTTKERRLQKIIPMIRAGIGLNDKYKN